MPYQVLPACADCGLLVRAQEVALARNLRSAQRSVRLADRLQPAGQRDARETRRRDDLASPQAHLQYSADGAASAVSGVTFSKRPILSTSRRNVELIRRAGTGHVTHAQLVSLAAQAMRAHAKRCRSSPVYIRVPLPGEVLWDRLWRFTQLTTDLSGG